MQSLVQTSKIDEFDRKQAILDILADKYCRYILQATIDKPKSATKISREQNIPISTVYRKLQMLHYGKLILITGSVNEDGKKHFLYQSKVKTISINYDCQTVDMRITSNKIAAAN